MRELIDQHDFWPPGQHGVEVHFLELGAAVGDPGPGDNLQVADLLGSVRAAMRLDVADDDVGAALDTAMTLVEHRERLADASGGPEIDPQQAAAAGHAHGPDVSQTLRTHHIPLS